MIIHATRPFVVNERIKTKIKGYEVSGRVEVSIYYLTYLKGSIRELIQSEWFPL
jgi:MscS family membrane protein